MPLRSVQKDQLSFKWRHTLNRSSQYINYAQLNPYYPVHSLQVHFILSKYFIICLLRQIKVFFFFVFSHQRSSFLKIIKLIFSKSHTYLCMDRSHNHNKMTYEKNQSICKCNKNNQAYFASVLLCSQVNLHCFLEIQIFLNSFPL